MVLIGDGDMPFFIKQLWYLLYHKSICNSAQEIQMWTTCYSLQDEWKPNKAPKRCTII